MKEKKKQSVLAVKFCCNWREKKCKCFYTGKKKYTIDNLDNICFMLSELC